MKRPSVLSGIGFAVLVGLLSIPALWSLNWVIAYSTAFKIWCATLYVAYLSYLYRNRSLPLGTVTLLAVNLFAVTLLLFTPVRPFFLAGILGFGVFVNRSLLWHRSIWSFIIDGVLVLGGFAFAGHLFSRTALLSSALWGFFLLQALFVLIPTKGLINNGETSPASPDRFVRNLRSAEDALECVIGGV